MMNDHTNDRFIVLCGHEDLADHILDTAEVQLEETIDEAMELLVDLTDVESQEELREREEFDGMMDILRSIGEMPGELMCSHGSAFRGENLVSLSEYADVRELEQLDFDSDAPGEMCSYCWSNTRELIAGEAEREETGIAKQIGKVGYRLRWKQKGRARKEWYDIVVQPETTMAELDKLVYRFTTLDDFHLRMYGLEDEYLQSSIKVVPDKQHSANPSNTPASEVTIAEVAQQATLWEGDQLSLVYDFGTPAHFYCLVKEVYELEELDSVLTESNPIAETETAAIVQEKRP
jgi:hypothetical protein